MYMVDVNHGLVTVLAGYVQRGTWSPVTLRWIRAVRSVSRYLVLVFDQDDLSIPVEFADDDGVAFIARRHQAYDFGSYRIGLQDLETRGWLSDASHVLLCNDSVIGPLFDLAELLDKMIENQAPVWGLSESYLYSPHLQSYFLLMDIAVASQSTVRQFFEDVVPQSSRHDVIQAYELGFSRLIKDLDLEWKVWLPAAEMSDPQTGDLMGNGMAHPVSMIGHRLPVIKTRSLQESDANEDGISHTCSVIDRNYPSIWAELWEFSQYRRLWQQEIDVEIILKPTDVSMLQERISWIKQHPHPNLKCSLAVSHCDIKLRTHLAKEFKSEIKNGLLSIHAYETSISTESLLIQLLAASRSELIAMSSARIWACQAALQSQIRMFARNRTNYLNHRGALLRLKDSCFDMDVISSLMAEYKDQRS